MIDGDKILAFLPAFNEEGKIGKAVSKIPTDCVDQILVVDDGSTDNTKREADNAGALVIRKKTTHGVGSAIKTGIEFGKQNGFSVLVILAGNNKDDPTEIPKLIDPIVKEGYDLVQGSRYLIGGFHYKMPKYRLVATKYIHPLLFSLVTRHRITDSTNGFRAFKLSILDDERIDIYQDWLDKYELEPYLLYKAVRLGYKVKEVPVRKIYPSKEQGYTKMKPFIGWWSILRPLFYLSLGIKK